MLYSVRVNTRSIRAGSPVTSDPESARFGPELITWTRALCDDLDLATSAMNHSNLVAFCAYTTLVFINATAASAAVLPTDLAKAVTAYDPPQLTAHHPDLHR